MKIVAFLQNMWVRNPDRVKATMERHPEYRLKFLAYALFAGCMTGRRLKTAFGELCGEIIWEEASPVISGDSKAYFPPDPEHIRKVLAEHRPEIVLTFTRRGEEEIRKLVTCEVICCPHPAARQATVMDELKAAALRVRLLRVDVQTN